MRRLSRTIATITSMALSAALVISAFSANVHAEADSEHLVYFNTTATITDEQFEASRVDYDHGYVVLSDGEWNTFGNFGVYGAEMNRVSMHPLDDKLTFQIVPESGYTYSINVYQFADPTGEIRTISPGTTYDVRRDFSEMLPCDSSYYSISGNTITVDFDVDYWENGIGTGTYHEDTGLDGSFYLEITFTPEPSTPAPAVAPTAPASAASGSEVSVNYSTHVQNIGWQDYVYDGAMAGTEGQSLRLEAMAINIDSDLDLGVRYKTHVENVGWQDWVYDGAASGTSGQSLRLEGMNIELTGSAASEYDIYYRVHVQNIGWMDWVKNGEMAGTEGQALRLEGMQIKILPKGQNINFISYNTHVQNIGWQSSVTDGLMAGTTGQSLRLEGIHISVVGLDGVGVEYRTHIQNIGWEENWTSDGGFSGTEGQSLRLEAIEIRLTGANADQYDIYYRTHVQNFGWSGWASEGASCGSAGYSYRLEGIEIIIVPAGTPAPGSTANSFWQA